MTYTTEQSPPAARTTLDLAVASGRNIKDSRLKSGQPYDSITVRELLTVEHTSVPKNQARWFLCSTYREADAREHKVQELAGRFVLITFDMDRGNVDGRKLAAALDEFTGGAIRRIYSTNSATHDDKRWRGIVPLIQSERFDTWHALQLALARFLSQRLGVTVDAAAQRAGQVIYLPNTVPQSDGDKKPYKGNSTRITGPLFDWRSAGAVADLVIQIMAEQEEEQRLREQKAAEARSRMAQVRAGGADGERSVIERFNQAHDIENLLAAYGYAEGPRNTWRSPQQTTSSYATKVFRDAGGEYWVSQSASDAASGLGATAASGGCYGDAFDLFAHYEHAGDRSKAIRAAADRLGIKPPPSMAKMLEDMVRNAQAAAALAAKPATFPATDGGAEDAQDAEDADPPANILPFVQASNLPNWEPPRELIEGFITEGSMTVIYGDSNTGKSFLMLDMAAHLVTGREWFGRRLRKGAVVYLAAESPRSIMDRARAIEMHTGVSLEHLFITTCPIDLFDPNGSTMAVVETVRHIQRTHGVEVVLIVIDTLARAMGAGDENKTQDMGVLVKHSDLIRQALGAAIAYVHHTGKDASRGARGSSALRAATDTEIEVRDPGDDKPREFELTKQRDLPGKGEVLGFTLKNVTLGLGVFGNMVSTCVIEPAEPAGPDPYEGLREGEHEILDMIRESPVRGLRYADLVDRASVSETTLKRNLRSLEKKGLVYRQSGQWRLGDGKKADILSRFEAGGEF